MDEIYRQYHEVANIFPLMQGEEFEALKNDIAEHGQREPIWLATDGRIIDGRNRHRACCELGISPKFTIWDGNGSLVYFVVSLNLHRRHLNSGQKAIIAVDILPLLEVEAKEKQKAQGSRGSEGGRGKTKTLDQSFDQGFERTPQATAQAAAIVGSNRQYVSEAKRLVQESPEVADLVRAGEITMPEAKSLAKMDDDKRAHAIELMQGGEAKSAKDAMTMVAREQKITIAQNLPPKVYNVIYADPAWEYSNTGVHGAADHHYDTMPTEKLKTLLADIEMKLADNAVLFLWVTNPLLLDAVAVVEAWGFQYKTNMVWVKTELVKPGSGFYVRGRHELLFICTRGSFTPLNPNIAPPIGSIVESPVREHSRKPETVYDIIEALYPGCNYVELFARTKRSGWDAWGNQVDKFAAVAQ